MDSSDKLKTINGESHGASSLCACVRALKASLHWGKPYLMAAALCVHVCMCACLVCITALISIESWEAMIRGTPEQIIMWPKYGQFLVRS